MAWQSIARNSCQHHDHNALVWTYHRRLEQHIRLEQRHAAHGNCDKYATRSTPKEERRNPSVLLACLDKIITHLKAYWALLSMLVLHLKQQIRTSIQSEAGKRAC